MPPRTRTIAQLRRELAAREKELSKLLAQRRKIEAGLGALDRKIMAIGGEVPSEGPGRGPTVRRGRRGTGRTLVEYVRQVLASAPKGMRAREVTDAVIAAGYRSSSRQFGRIVGAALRDTPGIRRVRRGVYRLTKRPKK